MFQVTTGEERLVVVMCEVKAPFQAPELFEGRALTAGPASDRWAAGVVILQLICQRPLCDLLWSLPPDHAARQDHQAAKLRRDDLQQLLARSSSVKVGAAMEGLVLDLLHGQWDSRPTDEHAVERVRAATPPCNATPSA